MLLPRKKKDKSSSWIECRHLQIKVWTVFLHPPEPLLHTGCYQEHGGRVDVVLTESTVCLGKGKENNWKELLIPSENHREIFTEGRAEELNVKDADGLKGGETGEGGVLSEEKEQQRDRQTDKKTFSLHQGEGWTKWKHLFKSTKAQLF